MQFLNDLTLFAVRPSILSGTRRLDTARESTSRRRVTTQDVVSTTALAGFNQISTGLFRMCRGYGSKLQILNAWAVHNTLADEVESKLKNYESRFNTQVAQFIEDFPRLNNAWALERPEERDDIIRLAYTEDELRTGFRFAMARFQLKPEQIQAQSGLEDEITGLAGTAFKEFADQLRDVGIKDPSKHLYTGGISTTLSQIARKAGSLAFLDPRMAEVSRVLNDLTGMLPPRGRVEGATAVLLRVVVDRLMNPAILQRDGFPMLETDDASAPAPAPQVVQSAPPPAPAKKATTKPSAKTPAKVPETPIDDEVDTSWQVDEDDATLPTFALEEALGHSVVNPRYY